MEEKEKRNRSNISNRINFALCNPMPGNLFSKKCGVSLLYSVMHAALNFTPLSPSTHLFLDLNIILSCRISFETSSLVR